MPVNVSDLVQFINLFNQFNELMWNASDVALEALYEQATSMMEDDRTDSQMSSSLNKLPVWRHRDNFHWIIVSVILHASIFLFGFVTNGILIYVAWKGKFLRIPAYCYLVSLAGADFLVLCTTLPMEMISYFTDRMNFNQAGCAALAGLSFVGINVGSLSVLTFTVELQVAVCQPILTNGICRNSRTKAVIRYSWLAVFVYSIAWLSFTNLASFFTQSSDKFRSASECSLFMPLNAYLSFFTIDFLLFYCIPLTVAAVVYVRLFIATKGKCQNSETTPAVGLEKKRRVSTGNSMRQRWIKNNREKAEVTKRTSEKNLRRTSLFWWAPDFGCWFGFTAYLIMRIPYEDHPASAVPPMLRLLLVIVIICGIAWLPFRLIPVYKIFWTGSLLDTWFLYFSSTLIYMKCAANPLLYVLLSLKFRTAVRRYCFRNGQRS